MVAHEGQTVTLSEARITIMKAFDDYDNGVITRIAFSQVIDETTQAVYDTAYESAMDDEDVIFEADLDLDEELE